MWGEQMPDALKLLEEEAPNRGAVFDDEREAVPLLQLRVKNAASVPQTAARPCT
jgi:hypothetical protein